MSKPLVFILGALAGYFVVPFVFEIPARFGGR